MSCSLSRPGRSSLDSVRWKKMSGAVRMLDMSLFNGGRSTHVASCMCPQWEAPTFFILHSDKAGRKPGYYITQRDSAHGSPLNVMGTIYWTQCQGYENTTYQAHSFFFNFLLLFNYSCVSFLPIPPPHPSRTPLPPPPPPSPLILSMCPL